MEEVGMRTRFLGLVLLLAALAAACGNGGPRIDKAQGATQGDQSSLPDGAALIADNSLIIGSATYRLGATAGAPLVGALAPLSVPSPDGSQYLYNSWAQGADVVCSGDPAVRGNCKNPAPSAVFGRPTLRLFTPASSRDVVVEPGAMSAAWRADGAIGYFKGDALDVPADAARFTGHLYVRPSVQSAPVRWTTTPARYVAVAWAGNTLIAYRQFEGERFDVLALDEPGSVRTLATDATVVSVSPDGTQLVVNRDTDGSSVASVVSVANGAVSSTLDLAKVSDPSSGTPLAWVTYGGSWDGDLVAAESSVGVALFRVRSGTISFDSVLLPKKSDYPMGVHEPQLFRGKSGALDLIAWAPVSAPTKNGRAQAVLTCDVSAKACKKNSTRDERSVGVARGRNGRRH
jgi:hypothetical protein